MFYALLAHTQRERQKLLLILVFTPHRGVAHRVYTLASTACVRNYLVDQEYRRLHVRSNDTFCVENF